MRSYLTLLLLSVSGLILAVAVINPVAGLLDASNTTDQPAINLQSAVRDDQSEIREDYKILRRLLLTKDLKSFMEFKDGIERKWSTKPEIRRLLLAEICKSLNSVEFRNPKQALYARHCAMQLLDEADELSPDSEMDLIRILQEIEEYRLGVADFSRWEMDRQRRIGYLHHFFKRIASDYDPAFDFRSPDHIPRTIVCVPSPKYRCGIAPDEVREPEIRTKYVEAINENQKRVLKFNAQRQIHRIVKRLPSFVDSFIVGMYSQKPSNPRELSTVLKRFNISGTREENILRTIGGIR